MIRVIKNTLFDKVSFTPLKRKIMGHPELDDKLICILSMPILLGSLILISHYNLLTVR
jgi:hypothetical protein